jgi:hypothetical protein
MTITHRSLMNYELDQPASALLCMTCRLKHYYVAKGGGTLRAGSAAALLVFGPVMPKGELALLVLGVCENWHY